MSPEELFNLGEDVAALVAWRGHVEERLNFLEEKLNEPADLAELRRLRSMRQIREYRREHERDA
jgi:hypothetical protein